MVFLIARGAMRITVMLNASQCLLTMGSFTTAGILKAARLAVGTDMVGKGLGCEEKRNEKKEKSASIK